MALGKLLKDAIHFQDSKGLLVTPKVSAFLRSNPEGLTLSDDRTALSDDSKAIVQKVMDAAFAGNEDRSGRFGSSSRGSCMRAQIWAYHGMPTQKVIEPEVFNLFNDGKYRHLRWQVMLLQSGAATHAEHRIALDSYRMRSSVDALHMDEEYIIEIKGDRQMSRLMGKDGGVDEKHALQIESMLLMTGMERCAYIMEDKGSQVWREIIVTSDPDRRKAVIEELKELNEHVSAGTVPEPLEACKRKEGPYKTCPFAQGCIARYKAGQRRAPLARDWDA